MTQQRHGNRRQMITVVFNVGIFQVRLVPDAGIGERDMGIIRQDGLAACGFIAGKHPGIASKSRAREAAEGGKGVQPAGGAFQATGYLRGGGCGSGAVSLVFSRFFEAFHDGHGHLFKFREKHLDVPVGILFL
ncbi:MAG: hypothetical protein BWY09_00775 [Candidatus Hydrogenedentes bacterium ADurb.Bin179]|nr:MAG: hypothetical protein BWY09_00775 [Candidatus Hydrogenedentes bacterium ADurb.Bin179]